MYSLPYRQLAHFAGNLATCLDAGLGVELSLKTCKASLVDRKYRAAVDVAVGRVRAGAELSAALRVSEARWPPFFVPLLEAGEQTGRLGEVLRYLEHQCRMLEGPARALQTAWMYPLGILLMGSLIQLLIILVYGSWGDMLAFVLSTARDYGTLVVLGLPFFAPPLKPLVDPLKLATPFLGQIERDLSVNRFFRVLSLLYSAGSHRVESMIELASLTVPNLAVRGDLQLAAAEVVRGRSLAEAFEAPQQLTPDEKNSIAAGDLSGTLERSFERISESTGESLKQRLVLFQQFAVRLTYAAVSFSFAVSVLRIAVG